jgi:superfamily II DNA or RNA helicase
MAPTGAGKTFLGMRVISEALKKGKRAMFLCDRRTLIRQTSETATRYGLGDHSVIMADDPRLDLTKQFQIASLQTLERRGWPEVDVLIVDEAHTLYKTWVDFVTSKDCKAMVVGLSATPFSKGLGKVFTNLINAATMADLTDSGVLVPMRVFSCRKPDMTGAKLNIKGEWAEEAAEERELCIVGDVVSEWKKLAENRKTIVFGATIRHCEEIVRQFRECGVNAATFTADTTEAERSALLGDFSGPDPFIRVLVSVEALAKGFDVPDVGCVCDCRPLRKSLSTAIQMWGRGLRCSPETGKEDCFLLDFSGNIIRFADDFSDVFFNGLDKLDDGEKLDKEVRKDEDHEPKPCPKCGNVPMGKRCVRCGYEPERKSLVEALPGEMQEIRIGKKVLAPDSAHLYAQVATYARLHSAPEKQNGRAAHLFRDMTGAWPPRDWRVESAPIVEPTRATLGKIKSLQIAFHNRRAY